MPTAEHDIRWKRAAEYFTPEASKEVNQIFAVAIVANENEQPSKVVNALSQNRLRSFWNKKGINYHD